MKCFRADSVYNIHTVWAKPYASYPSSEYIKTMATIYFLSPGYKPGIGLGTMVWKGLRRSPFLPSSVSQVGAGHTAFHTVFHTVK